MTIARMRRARTMLAVLVAGAGILIVVAGDLVCRRLVALAADDLLRAEAHVAAQVWTDTRTSESLEQVVPNRWALSDSVEAGLEEPVIRGNGTSRRASVTLYDTDGWQPTGTLSVRPADTARNAPSSFSTVLALALVGLGAWLWRASGRTIAAFAVVVAASASGLAAAGVQTRQTLGGLSTDRLALAVRALEAVPAVEQVTARPGGPQLLTGLPFLVREGTTQTLWSGLPAGVTEDLPGAVPGPDGRVVLDETPYRIAQVGSVVLVLLPYEHVHDPLGWLLGLLLVGTALAALPAALSHLTDRPRLLRRTLVAWSFLAPGLLHLAIFTVGPLLFAGWLSFHRWSLIDAARPFVGLDNYASLLADPLWWNALGNTAVFALHVPVSMALALAFALLTRRRRRGIEALRAVFFLPTITSLVAVAIVWQWMLHDEVGLINWALGLVGIGPVPWLSSPRTALPALVLMAVWLVVGYQMVLFQAGLAAIPAELYEAARIDGAGRWGRFVHVTLPGLRHTLFFVLVTSIIGSFQMFGAVYVMTGGGPLHATDVAVFHIYEEAWEYLRFGTASAMSWMLFAVIFVLTWLQFRVLERRAVPE
jgi:ABC-type sugar transport system permease subunit